MSEARRDGSLMLGFYDSWVEGDDLDALSRTLTEHLIEAEKPYLALGWRRASEPEFIKHDLGSAGTSEVLQVSTLATKVMLVIGKRPGD